MKQHIIKEEGLVEAKKKLYTMVWKLMSQALKNKIAGRAGFAEHDRRGDAIKLTTGVRF